MGVLLAYIILLADETVMLCSVIYLIKYIFAAVGPDSDGRRRHDDVQVLYTGVSGASQGPETLGSLFPSPPPSRARNSRRCRADNPHFQVFYRFFKSFSHDLARVLCPFDLVEFVHLVLELVQLFVMHLRARESTRGEGRRGSERVGEGGGDKEPRV